jgi:hypothetical protein
MSTKSRNSWLFLQVISNKTIMLYSCFPATVLAKNIDTLVFHCPNVSLPTQDDLLSVMAKRGGTRVCKKFSMCNMQIIVCQYINLRKVTDIAVNNLLHLIPYSIIRICHGTLFYIELMQFLCSLFNCCANFAFFSVLSSLLIGEFSCLRSQEEDLRTVSDISFTSLA